MLELLPHDRFEDDAQSFEMLLPVHEVLLTKRISLRHYASALMRASLNGIALSHLDTLNASDTFPPELSARASLLRLYLEESGGSIPSDIFKQREKEILTDLYRSLPYYHPSSLEALNEQRPLRVEVTSPLRIDLGMGGISDLPPRSNEQPGRAVSLCVNIDQSPPIRCVAELTDEPGIRFEAVGSGPPEIVSTWDELGDTTTSTAIVRACFQHLFSPVEQNRDLPNSVMSVLGGGLLVQTFSVAPKGLGSSSILASVVLQTLLRLLGHRIDWQDIVHRTVTIERMMGVGGGWEDALPAFFGGIVLAESVPSRLPIITAKNLTVSPRAIATLQKRLVLFDTEQEGYSGEVLAEGILRYLSGDSATLKACDALHNIGRQIASTIEMGNLKDLGTLLSEQWDAWKIITGGLCTNDYIDDILNGAKSWVDGAKVNGSGSGGAILFVVAGNKLDYLLKYLEGFKGAVIHWQADSDGYKLREWNNS